MQYLDAFLEKYPTPPVHFVGVPVDESLSKKQLIGIVGWLANHIQQGIDFDARISKGVNQLRAIA